MDKLRNIRTMSSREIAELTGKRHDHVLRDIEILNRHYDEIPLPRIGEGYYLHPNTGNQKHREFNLTKIQTLDLMTGYDVKLRIRVNRRWEELESQSPDLDSITRLDIARMLVESETERIMLSEKSKLQEEELKKAAPKVQYYEEVLDSESCILTNVIAKELGMSAVTLNRCLNTRGVVYKQGGTWLLYHAHQNKGYAKTKTYSFTDQQGKTQTSIQLVWTEKGRAFIHDLMRDRPQNIVKP